MNEKVGRLCPVEKSGSLDSRIRRWLQKPQKILGSYIREGMTVLDLGCGPGFFSLDMAQMVGKSGKVFAADLQEGMLKKLKEKIKKNELGEQIILYKSEKNQIGVSDKVDFVLAFYMVHEVPDKEEFFKQLAAIVKPNGQFLIVEPPFHVSKIAFEAMIKKSEKAGFTQVERPKVFLSKAVLLKKPGI